MYSKQYFTDPDILAGKMDCLVRVYNLATTQDHGVVGDFDAASYQKVDYGNGTGIIFLRVSIEEIVLGYSTEGKTSFEEFSRMMPHHVESLLYFPRAVLTSEAKPEFMLWRNPDDTVWNHDESLDETTFIKLTDPLFMSPEALYYRVFDTFYHANPDIVPETFSLERVQEEMN